MPQRDGTPAQAVLAAAEMVRHLDPGQLAELRRMNGETGAPAFWRLAARYPSTIGQESKQKQWIALIRIVPILTPKDDPATRVHLHDPNRRLGAVLCDGGDRSWPPNDGGKPRPVFSEHRLAQLMAARGTQRGVLLTRAARTLARSRTEESGINILDIACTLLAPDNGRHLAEPYYRRLDRAERAVDKPEEGIT